MELLLGAVALIANILGMAGIWQIVNGIYMVNVEAPKVGGEAQEGVMCDLVAHVGLWRKVCFKSECPDAMVSYKCGRLLNEPSGNDQHWIVTETFMCLAFIFSLISMTASCAVFRGSTDRARKAVGFLWVASAVAGIIAMSVWVEYVLPDEENAPVFYMVSKVYGWGFASCIIGWIFSVLTAVVTFYIAGVEIDDFTDTIVFPGQSQTVYPAPQLQAVQSKENATIQNR
eukprot:g2874.t1